MQLPFAPVFLLHDEASPSELARVDGTCGEVHGDVSPPDFLHLLQMPEQLIIFLCPRWRAKGHPSGLGGGRTVDAAAIGVVVGAEDAAASADIGADIGAGIKHRAVCNAVGLHVEEPAGLLPRVARRRWNHRNQGVAVGHAARDGGQHRYVEGLRKRRAVGAKLLCGRCSRCRNRSLMLLLPLELWEMWHLRQWRKKRNNLMFCSVVQRRERGRIVEYGRAGFTVNRGIAAVDAGTVAGTVAGAACTGRRAGTDTGGIVGFAVVMGRILRMEEHLLCWSA